VLRLFGFDNGFGYRIGFFELLGYRLGWLGGLAGFYLDWLGGGCLTFRFLAFTRKHAALPSRPPPEGMTQHPSR